MAFKKGDFIEITYTGKLKDGDLVFDTTDEAVAKEQGIHNPKVTYKPIIIAIGEGHVLPGLDKHLEGKETGKYTFTLTPEEGFGKKSAAQLKLMPASVFKQQKIDPMPGLEVNVDGMNGIIKTVSGGRVIVDFNHPLASKELVYEIEVKRPVTDLKEKADALVSLLHLPLEIKVVEGKVTVVYKTDFPAPVREKLEEDLKRLLGVKEMATEVAAKEAPQQEKPAEPSSK